MELEAIIQQIIAKRPEFSREKILEKLENERRETGGFISDESLLRVIAAELGVEIPSKSRSSTALIKDLVPNLGDVTVTGRVVAVFRPKTFNEKTVRKMASLLIADESGIFRVVLWNDKVSILENGGIKVGQIVRFIHGYTRENRRGKVELHIAEKGVIQVEPADVNAGNYPTINKFNTKVREALRAGRGKSLNLCGKVKQVFTASTFNRGDSTTGKVMRFVLADETGEINVVAWNEKVDELEATLKRGVKLQLIGAKAKKAAEGDLELHVDNETYFETQTTLETCKIAELKEGLNHVNVEGEVAANPILREVETSKGEMVKVTSFEVRDETGSIWITAWRQHAETAAKLKRGDKITIKDAYVKRGFEDRPELSTRNTTTITLKSS